MKRSVRLELPPVVSLNQCYRTVNGRMLISKAGRGYRKDVEWIAACSHIKFGKARLRMDITVHKDTKRRYDLDNTVKGIQDALQHGGLYDDDGQIDILHVERGAVGKPCAIVVITEI